MTAEPTRRHRGRPKGRCSSVSVWVPVGLRDKLKAMAAQTGQKSISAVIRALLANRLK